MTAAIPTRSMALALSLLWSAFCMPYLLAAEAPKTASPAAANASPTAAIEFLPLPRERREIRIAIYAGPGSQESGIRDVERGAALLPGARVQRLAPADVAQGELESFDVVVFPAGGASTQARAIGDRGRENVRRFVREGGAYLGICAGAYLACAEFDWGLQLIAAETLSDRWQRGVAVVQMKLTAEGREAFGPVDGPLPVAYENGPVIGPLNVEGLAPYRTLASFATEVAENDSPPGIMTGSPAIVEGRFGKGRVMIFSPHPERTAALERLTPLVLARLTADEGGAEAQP